MEQGYAGVENNISPFADFLRNKPLQYLNLSPSETGEVRFSANLSSYTQLVILAIDTSSVAQKCYDLPVNQILTRDLSLGKVLDVSKGFTESRTTHVLLKGEEYSIEDINSTELQIVDDLEKVKAVFSALQKFQGGAANNIMKDLDFVLKWHTLQDDEKHKLYSKNACHELNIFLYFRDKAYFKAVVS